MGKVVLLGAGFSRAISSHMPLLDDLAVPVLDRLDLPLSTLDPFGGDVEAWLAYIGGDEPWRTDSDNLRSNAIFVDAVAAISDVIAETEQRALAEPLPDWLVRLAWQWSHDHTTILTFNYDTLLEHAFQKVGWIHRFADLYPIALTERAPVGRGLYPSPGVPEQQLPAVYKLHGSTNWMHGGNRAPTTEQLVFRDAGKDAQPGYQHLYDDLQPFVVPPTSSKNTYYDRAPLRVQWRAAAEALRTASKIDIIGYSFPPSDTGTRAFLATTVANHTPITLVDPSDKADGALARAFPGHPAAHRYSSVADFVDATCGDVVTTWYENTVGRRVFFTDINGTTTEEPLPDEGDDFEPLVRERLHDAFPAIEHVTDVPLHDSLRGRRGFNPGT